MIKRVVAAVVGAGGVVNGVFMLADGARWYDTVPGLAHTGPYHPHFVADIGAAYLVSGLALAARAWQPRYWPAAVVGAAFFCAHAIIHMFDIVFERTGNIGVDVGLVIVPAALSLWAALPDGNES